MQKRSHQKNKHQGSPSSKTLGTILKMDKEGTKTNGPGNKKADDDVQGLTSERWHRQIMYVKKRRRRGLDNIEESAEASIRGLENYIKKNKERLITETNNCTYNMRTNRTTIN